MCLSLHRRPSAQNSSGGRLQQWTVPGVVLRDYIADIAAAHTIALGDSHDGNEQTALNGKTESSLKFFWVSTTAPPPNFDANEVSIEVGNIGPAGNTLSYTRSTKFDVYRPTAVMAVDSTGNTVLALDEQDQPMLALADEDRPDQAGIVISGAVAMPTAFTSVGEWQFLQTVVPGRWRTKADGTRQRLDLNGELVLDTYFGLPTVDGPTIVPTGPEGAQMLDTPKFPLTGLIAAEVDDVFNPYIMFRPPGPDSRWVPLKKLQWFWQANAVAQGNQWDLVGSWGPNPTAPVDTTDLADVPVWTKNVTSFNWINV